MTPSSSSHMVAPAKLGGRARCLLYQADTGGKNPPLAFSDSLKSPSTTPSWGTSKARQALSSVWGAQPESAQGPGAGPLAFALTFRHRQPGFKLYVVRSAKAGCRAQRAKKVASIGKDCVGWKACHCAASAVAQGGQPPGGSSFSRSTASRAALQLPLPGPPRDNWQPALNQELWSSLGSRV